MTNSRERSRLFVFMSAERLLISAIGNATRQGTGSMAPNVTLGRQDAIRPCLNRPGLQVSVQTGTTNVAPVCTLSVHYSVLRLREMRSPTRKVPRTATQRFQAQARA
jgi:hypothetical protein